MARTYHSCPHCHKELGIDVDYELEITYNDKGKKDRD